MTDPERARRDDGGLSRALCGVGQVDSERVAAALARTEAKLLGASTTTPPDYGRYVFLKELGAGGFGRVDLAYDPDLDRKVALKQLLRGASSRALEDGGREALLREAQTLAKLRHPHIVSVYGVQELTSAKGRKSLSIVMEFVEGVTLREWLSAEERPLKTILRVFIEAGRGLQAAHEAGIIHRDFKPDNVLIGLDGRARVADFGLAAEGLQIGGRDVTLDDDDGRLTLAGAILGTPRYMAPEQRRGDRLDPSADQYSFCVTAYEALYGAHPFAGAEPGAKASGPPAGPTAWIWPILWRGLSEAPEDRYASVAELLDALGRDPVQLRRRRLRNLGIVLTSAAIAALLIIAGLALKRRWQRAAIENEASRVYGSVEARIERALASREDDEVERIFSAFVAEPLYAETEAVGRAWLDRAQRLAASGELERARVAAATAYTRGQTSDQRRAALLTLGRVFERDFDWSGLAALLDLLDREGPGDAAEDAERERLRGAAAFGQRDLQRAAELDVGPARALLGATKTRYPMTGPLSEVEVDGAPMLILYGVERGKGMIYGIRRTSELEELWRHDLGVHTRVIVPGERPFILVGMGPERPLNSLYRVHPSGLDEVARFAGAAPTCAEFIDLDGDGEEELYFSTGLDLEIARLDLAGDGALQPRIVVDAYGTLESYCEEMISVEVDGEPALAMALRGFRAHDVRILQLGAGGRLETRFREKIGTIAGISQIERLGEPLLAVASVPWDEDPRAFPPDRPYGEAAGIHLIRITGGGLERVLDLPVDVTAPTSGIFRESYVGDINGDGREDMGFDVRGSSARQTIFFLQREDGSFARSVLGRSILRGFVELGGKPGEEALVHLDDVAGGEELWALGSGTEDIPPLVQRDLPAGELAEEEEPLWMRRWSDAVSLGRLGLRELASAAFVELAKDSALETSRIAAKRWGAAMRAELHDDEGTLDLLREIIALHEDSDTLAQIYRLARFLGEYDLALRALSKRSAELGEEERLGLSVELERLASLAAEAREIDVRMDRPLGPEWVIEAPHALHRQASTSVLEISTSSSGVLAWLPIMWEGDFLDIDLDMSLRHTEWGTELHVEVVPEEDPTGASVLSFDVSTVGTSRGGLVPRRSMMCTAERYGVPVFDTRGFPTSTDEPIRLRARARLAPVIGEYGCSATNLGSGQSFNRRYQFEVPMKAGAYRLVIRSGVGVPALVSADLHRLTVRGASLREHPVEPAQAAISHALVEGHYRGALARAEAEGWSAGTLDQRMILSEAMVLTGRLAEVQATWRELLERSEERPDLATILTAQLRRAPQLYGSLLAGVSPAEHLSRVAAAWRNFAVNHRQRAELLPLFWEAVNNVDVDAGESLADKVDIQVWRSLLLSDVGDHRAGLREIERAIALIDDGPASSPGYEHAWEVALTQATLAARAGDRRTATLALARARAWATMPLVVEDRVRADPALSSIDDR